MKYRPPVRSRCWPAVALVCLGVLLPVAARAQESAVAKADLERGRLPDAARWRRQAIDEGVLWEILGLVPPNPEPSLVGRRKTFRRQADPVRLPDRAEETGRHRLAVRPRHGGQGFPAQARFAGAERSAARTAVAAA